MSVGEISTGSIRKISLPTGTAAESLRASSEPAAWARLDPQDLDGLDPQDLDRLDPQDPYERDELDPPLRAHLRLDRHERMVR